MIITFLPPAAKINVPHGDAPVLPSPAPAASANALLGSKVSDLACICGALGMAPPDFSFMRNRQVTRSIFCFCYVTLFSTLRFPLSQVPHSESFPLTPTQGLVLCQVKLSNGLMVHGPQCQSEHDAKEKAAFFALQRLVYTQTQIFDSQVWEAELCNQWHKH